MSHYFAAVVVPRDTTRDTAEPYVAKAMAPSDENGDGDLWDWWQIGGRWTGVWGEYDPDKDPRNTGPCDLCGGTGKRTDSIAVANGWTNQCNGCDSTGTMQKWPTQWVPYEGDVITVRAFLHESRLRRPFTVVLPDGTYRERESWDGNGDVAAEVSEADWPEVVDDMLRLFESECLVVVDYHE